MLFSSKLLIGALGVGTIILVPLSLSSLVAGGGIQLNSLDNLVEVQEQNSRVEEGQNLIDTQRIDSIDLRGNQAPQGLRGQSQVNRQFSWTTGRTCRDGRVVSYLQSRTMNC